LVGTRCSIVVEDAELAERLREERLAQATQDCVERVIDAQNEGPKAPAAAQPGD